MIKRTIFFCIFVVIIIAGIVQARTLGTTHASTSPISSAHNVLKKPIKQENFKPNQGEIVGIVSIPRLNSEFPIVEANEDMMRGASHNIDSSYPNEDGTIILTLLENAVVQRIHEIQVGDEIVFSLPYGNFTYQIKESYPDTDFESLKYDTESLILSTPDQLYTIVADRVKATN
jgi:sortase A